MSEKPDLYQFLGLSPDADTATLQAALKAKADELTQQTTASGDDLQSQRALLRFAKEILLDPVQRQRYDARHLSAQTASVARPPGQAPSQTLGLSPAQSPVKPATTPTAARRDALTHQIATGEVSWQVARPSPWPRRLLLLSLLVAAGWGAYHTVNSRKTPPAPVPADQASASPAGETLAPQGAPGPLRASEESETPAPRNVPATAGSGSSNNNGRAYDYKVTINTPNAELLKKLVWSVYAISGSNALGTGILIDSEKLLTNCHVVAANARSGKMYATNAITKEKLEITQVAYLDYQDACLVRAPGLSGQVVSLGSTASLSSGQRLHNIGFANGQLTGSQGQFSGWRNFSGQRFIVSTNFCDHGVSGGPLVDDAGQLLGLTTGGTNDKSSCFSLSAETIAGLRFETFKPIGDFPENYISNLTRR